LLHNVFQFLQLLKNSWLDNHLSREQSATSVYPHRLATLKWVWKI
jgi:hypothetical protein